MVAWVRTRGKKVPGWAAWAAGGAGAGVKAGGPDDGDAVVSRGVVVVAVGVAGAVAVAVAEPPTTWTTAVRRPPTTTFRFEPIGGR